MERSETLDKAKATCMGQREQDYGTPRGQFRRHCGLLEHLPERKEGSRDYNGG